MNALVDHKVFAAATPVSPDVSLFGFKGHQIRVAMIEGEPWFVAVDVFHALDMDTSKGASKHLRYLGDDEKKTHALIGSIRRGNPSAVHVSESGLYKFLLRSDKPEAKPFQDWVTKEVLPAIRKVGAYIKGEEKVPKR